MGFLAGKKFLISGLLSNKSIAYGIATAMHREGAELAFTYQTDKFKDRVANMAQEFDSSIVIELDVASDESVAHAFEELSSHWPKFDGLVHSIAFAPREQLEGNFIDVVTREGFQVAHDISAYSLAAMTKAALPSLNEGSSIVTLSYLGAERAVPSYNVMGIAKASLEANVRYLASSLGEKQIRVNGISAGAIKTLAASGIKGFKKMLSHGEQAAPLKRNVSALEVGNTTAFLCSDLSSGITGEIVHVDAGYNIMAMADVQS